MPVLLAAPGGLVAIHAGWRGLAAGVIPRTVERLAAALGSEPAAWRAWIGPAIGACCYEVGEEVAAAVAAASDPGVVAPGPRGRPHLDLAAAARAQLVATGIGGARAPGTVTVAACTRCEEGRLWSFRRDGRGGGRNVAYVWRRGDGAAR